jgi:hypothetical protein
MLVQQLRVAGARLVIASACLAGVLSIASVARAEPSAADRAAAQSLFDEGRQLMDAGQYEQACERFARSQKIDAGGGTLLNLAMCHDKQGLVATAYTEYNDALSQALRDGRTDREQLARERIDALGPTIPRVRVSFAGGAPPGLEVRIDGEPLALDALDPAAPLLPMDPGVHRFTASAPDREPRTVEVTVAAGARVTNVVIPALGIASAQKTGETAPSSGSARKTTGYVIGLAGLAAIGVGVGFGVDALAKQRESNDKCPTDRCSDPSAVSASDHAVTSAWVSDIAIGAGVVAVGVALYLVLTSPSSSSSSTSHSAAVRPKAGLRGVEVQF